MQGADGIAVGMSTHILPHNFIELLEAEIAILEGREFSDLARFPHRRDHGCLRVRQGQGKSQAARKNRRCEIPKRLSSRKSAMGRRQNRLIRSIDEAAKKGKIKIEAINDYTAEKVEIEIKLPRGMYAEELLDALYGFTECEVTLHSQIIVIKDNLPWETDVA